MVESQSYSAAEEEEEEDSYIWMDPLLTNKGSGNDKKRRFSEEQVKSLELMFETQTKLEPKKKLQLAKELGMHPRQVSIWFQNKRARWKSKQLEREYNALRADYDALLSNFESLKNEKQLLAKQLQKLAQLLDKDKPTEERRTDRDCIKELLTEQTEIRVTSLVSEDEENQQAKYKEEETGLLCEQPKLSSLVASEQQLCFHQPSWPPDQSCVTSQWWESWTMNE